MQAQNEKCTKGRMAFVLVELVFRCCLESWKENPQIGTMSDTHNSKAGCVGFILVLSVCSMPRFSGLFAR